MRLKHSLIFSLFLGSFSLISKAGYLDGRIPVDEESERTILTKIIDQDPLKNSDLTPKIPPRNFNEKLYESIQLDGGLQLDPSCSLEASRLNFNNKSLADSFNKLMIRMLDRIDKCQKNYPELKPYLEQSISQFRREIIKCEPPKGQKGLIKRFGNSYSAYNDQKGITLGHDFFKTLENPDEDLFISVMFHEILHSTSCNNRHDHNQIEIKPSNTFTSKNACAENITMDRVNVVESLCMGTRLFDSTDDATVTLAHRIAMCGVKRGCIDLFTPKGNSYNFFNRFTHQEPTQDLSEDQATKLCQRIQEDGMCLHFRKTQGEILTRSNPHLLKASDKLKEKLKKILPLLSNKINPEILDLFPDLKIRIDSIKNDSCFKKHFYFNEMDGSFFSLNTKANGHKLENWNEFSYLTLDSHFKLIKSDFEKFLKDRSNSKGCDDIEKNITEILSDLSKRISEDNSLRLINHVVSSAHELSYTNLSYLNSSNSLLEKFVGRNILNEFDNSLQNFHYKSPHFNCVSAGLAPLRMLESAEKKENLFCE